MAHSPNSQTRPDGWIVRSFPLLATIGVFVLVAICALAVAS